MSEPGSSLYNRHRPLTFAELVGQAHVERALGNALRASRPAQGYLFSGSRGTGKTSTARILARCLNCQASDGPTPEPCGECDSCLRTGHDDWLDVVEVDAASSARRIDEIREWIETVRYAPVACRYRVTIMDEAHQIQDAASSALLKTLEEPPSHLVVILCTTQPWAILPTIRSRLQHFVLRRPEVPELITVLERVARAEGVDVSTDALDALARAAEGSFRDALGLLDQLSTYTGGRVTAPDVLDLIGAADRATLFELVQLVAGGDPAGAFELLVSTLDGGVDADQLTRSLVAHLRYLCLLQQGARARDEWGFAEAEIAQLTAQANQLPPARVVRGLDLLADAGVRVQRGAADPRLQLELVVAKLAQPELDPDIAALMARVQALESGVAPGKTAAASHPPPPIAPSSSPPVVPAAGTSSDAQPSPLDPGQAPETAPPAPEDLVVDKDHLTRQWPRVIESLASSPHLATFLSGTAVSEFRDDSVTVSVPGGVAADMLASPEHRGAVEDALERVAGRRLALTFEHVAPATANEASRSDDADVIEEFKTMFNAVEETDG